MIIEEEGKGHKKAFRWQEWKGSPKSVRSVMFLIPYFPGFSSVKDWLYPGETVCSCALDPKPANIIQEWVQEASTLCRKTTCYESVFIFKLLKLIAVKHMLNWKGTHMPRIIHRFKILL